MLNAKLNVEKANIIVHRKSKLKKRQSYWDYKKEVPFSVEIEKGADHKKIKIVTVRAQKMHLQT